MVNYYKILGIENYASVEVVKTAYKGKMRQYHPDINDHPEAVEIAQWLNRAKEVLSREERKRQYDRELKLAYIIEIARLKNANKQMNWRALSVAERRRRMEEHQKLIEKDAYERGLRIFPLRFRFAGLILIVLLGLQIVYKNYFVMFDGLERFYIMVGLVIFVAGLITITNQVYQYYWIRSVEKAIRFNYEKWIGRFLILSLFIGPLCIFGINEYRRSYHLQHHFEYQFANIELEKSSYSKIVYSYEWNGTEYIKESDISEASLFVLKEGRLLIKLATADPRISEIVYESNHYPDNKSP